ncbi:OmpA family protein [Croceibacterium mercuriale]|uniref:OmpA family protein n=1 Tax=Croceibacterium mercuriale TaxID=1572751 RepID=A0A0B2BWI7_9SPHN|nr:OmpA family protein [Croceibacterium mercuriale]KHL25744.1 OmpA family protein [Croceibacterium mercuriale]
MNMMSNKSKVLVLLSTLALPMGGTAMAQQMTRGADVAATVVGAPPADLSEYEAGPEVSGMISARDGNRLQVMGEDGTSNVVVLSEGTEIYGTGGFLGLDRDQLAAQQLLNGLPVTVKTVQWAGQLVATRVNLKNRDLRTASMIRTGTAQGFAEQTAATEALRGRLGDIDKYNIHGTTNVNFDTGKWQLTPQGQADLCAAAQQAEATPNALLLVVGYTDNVGDEDFNQELSERRAGRVVNYLQQRCGWAPYRMLTPTGMAMADPLADNSTEEGRAQNRRVAVNILVSKSVDGL